MTSLKNKYENEIPMPQQLLLKVSKPARYIGKEINMVKKDLNNIDIRFAFCFPDVYEIGMSHLGLQILYYFLNRREDCYCERVFAPWADMESIMRENSYALFSLETYTAVNKFDFVGFTLQYEMSYTNIVNMLDLSGIPIFSADRDEKSPIICAGGPCAFNPEPLADIVDFFYIGEGESSLDQILDIYKQNKNNGGSKEDFLLKLLSVEGVYVPKYYDVEYNDDGTIKSFNANNDKAPSAIKKVIVNDMTESFYPDKQLVPLMETVHDRVTLEVFRGCMRGCRFCQAGFVYRPIREKKKERLLEQAKLLVENSGHEEISLVSLSTGDYSDFQALSETIVDNFSAQRVNLSLPSLRIDAFNLQLMQKVQEVRKSSLTFAPEAGSQRLRDVINKNISEDEILNGCKLAFEGGWDRVKLYFMTGLPTETNEDLEAIGQMGEKIISKYYELPREKRPRPPSIVLSSSCFVPKPFTPFQWAAQNSREQFIEKHRIIKSSIKSKQIKYNHHDANTSVLEGLIARGDRKIGKVIVRAWELGARFDGWTEFFNFDTWLKALEQCGIDLNFYTQRERSFDEILPWDHISPGITKQFLINEANKALNSETTADCRSFCSGCGASAFGGGVCIEK